MLRHDLISATAKLVEIYNRLLDFTARKEMYKKFKTLTI